MNRPVSLKLKKDFKQVLDQGKKSVTYPFVLFSKPNDLGLVRFGIIVSKRALSKAAWRNRAKRRIRALVRGHKDRDLSFDFVFIIRKPCFAIAFSALVKEFEKVVR